MKKICSWMASVLLFSVSSAFACSDYLCETPEIQFQTGEAAIIKEKAQSLGSVVKIYEYLRNNAEYVPYHGARSSSLNTFLAMEGNDVDLASTLIAMYRSVGVKARYAVGNAKLPRADVANWLGVQNESLAVSILQNQGIDIVDNSGADHVVFEHVWVEALVNFSNYRGGSSEIKTCLQETDQCKWIGVDPSFKLKKYNAQYRNLLRDLEFDYDAYYRAEMDDSDLRDKSPLEIFEEQPLVYLRENHPGITLEDIVDVGETIVENHDYLPASLPFSQVGASNRYAVAYSKWSKSMRIRFLSVGCPAFSFGYALPRLSTNALVLSWKPNSSGGDVLASIGGQIEDTFTNFLSCTGEPVNAETLYDIELQIDGAPDQPASKVVYRNLRAGGYYLLAPGGDSSNWSQVRRAYSRLLNAKSDYPLVTSVSNDVYVDENKSGIYDTGDTLLTQNPDAQHALTGGLLYVAQALYYTRLKEEARRYSRLKNVVSPISSFIGVISAVDEVELVDGIPFSVMPGGLLIDLKGLRLSGSWEADKAEAYSNETFKFLGHISSSLEHEVWQELTGYDAISTMRGIQFALRDGAQLLDVHNTSQANLVAVGKSGAADTFPNALSAMGFTNSPSSGFTRKDYTIFDRQWTGWTYTGPQTDGMHVFKGQLTSSDSPQFFTEKVESNGKTITENILGPYDRIENELLKLKSTLKTRYIDIQGFPAWAEVTSATVSNPSGFVVDSIMNLGDGAWRFEVRETSDHGNGPVTITLWANYGTLVSANVSFDSSDYFSGGGSCNGISLTGAASTVLANLQSCFEAHPLVQFLDRNSGFNPTSYYYKKADEDGLGTQDHLIESVMKIRSGLYFTPSPYWRNYTLPSKIASGPFFAFNVYIEDVYRDNQLVENQDEISGLVSSSYIIENQSWRAPAGGGYVPPQVEPVKPADSTEGVKGSAGTLDATGVTFNNEAFTDKNLIALSNNDVIRTPSTVDPVSTVTGNMYHDETDLVIPGKGMPYAFTRTYNSNPTTTSGANTVNPKSLPLSQGWTHSYNMKLVSNDHGQYPNYDVTLAPENKNSKTSSITFIDERGGESNFLLKDSSTTSQPTSPRASFDTLVLNSPASNQHTLTFSNGVKYIFDSQGQNMRVPEKVARLLRIEDPYGNQLNFGYDSSGRLTSVRDNASISSRTGLTLVYYTSGTNVNRLRYLRDWTGRQWEYIYAGEKLTQVRNPADSSMEYTYVDGTHLLKDIIHPQVRDGVKKTMTFGYYENGQAYNYVDKLGSEESLIYDLFRRRTRVTNPRGLITEHYYDQNGALIKLVEPDNGILLFENNKDGLRYLKYDAMGNRTRYSYNTDRTLDDALSDTKGLVTREQDAMGKNIDYDYDPNNFNQIKKVTDKNGNTVTNNYYTATNTSTGAFKGKLQSVVVSSATVNGVVHANVKLSEYKYHADGTPKQIIEYIDPAQPSKKRVTDFVYEYLSGGGYRLTKTVSGSGKSLSVVEEYDALWRKVSATSQRRTSATNAALLSLTTSFAYDSLGRLTKTTDPLGNISETVYDANNQVDKRIVRYKLLPEGNSPKHAECKVDPDYPGHHSCVVETNSYDAADRLTSTTDVNGAVTHFEYDPMGNVTKVTNHLGNSLHYEYDAMGRRTRVRDENGYLLTTEYDLAGRVKAVTDANGKSLRYEYDALGRKTKVTTPEGRVTKFDQYDGNGNLLKMTDANAVASSAFRNAQGVSLYNEFDEFNRIKKSLNAEDEITQYTYDLLGNRTKVTDANNQTTTFVYNDLGQLIEVKDPIVESGTDKVVKITYDEVGNRLNYTDRLGEVTRYSYDKLNRLVKEEYVADNVSADKVYDQYGDLVSTSYGDSTYTYTYTYDAAHRMKSKTDSRTGKTMRWEYDAIGNLIRKVTFEDEIYTYDYNSSNRVVSMSAGDPVYIQASYHYDPAGRLLSRILSNGAATLYNYNADGFLTSVKQIGANGAVIDLREYQHDQVGNITKMVVNGSETIIYGYDSEYRLLGANSSVNSRDFSYTYDAVGNRKTKTHNGVTHHYIYSSKGNRLDKVRSGSATGPVVYSFEYDANGSMTGKFDGTGKKLVHVDYDQRRLAKVMGVNNQTSGLSFDYDANAYRIQKQSAAGTKKYLLEGEHLESIYGADNEVLATYLRGAVIDEVINGFERNSTGVMENRTFHHDQVNSVVALSDHNGTKTQSVVYGPFGESITSTGSNLNVMKYTGREQDAETGLYYYRARYYDPEIGRFISEDPIGFGGGINFYTYANGNPINFNDPTGNVCTSVQGTTTCIAPIGDGLTFSFPTPDGWPERIDSSHDLHHLYDIDVGAPGVDPVLLRQAIIERPTPGNPSPASAGGTLNDATPAIINSLFSAGLSSSATTDPGGPVNFVDLNYSPVNSYEFYDPSGNAFAVNVTQPGHPLHPGYVARAVVDSSSGPVVHNVGEGLGWLQSDNNPLSGLINGVWNGQTQSIIDGLNNGANGGFVLYPGRINSNMMKSVYAK